MIGIPASLRAVAAVLAWLLAVVPASAQQADPLLVSAQSRYAEVNGAVQSVTGPTALPDLAPIAGEAPRGAPTDLRIAMLKIARTEEASTQQSVLRAQTSPVALSLMSGAATLDQMLALASSTVPEAVGPHGLRVPLIIEAGATLSIRDGATLSLDRSAGAAVINFGTLEIAGGAVVAAGPSNGEVGHFAPFVVTAGQGVMTARSAYFEGLGFGSGPTFAGVSVVTGGLFAPAAGSSIDASVFRDVTSAAFVGAHQPRVTDTVFTASRGPALVLRGTRDARVMRTAFLDGRGGGGIRVGGHATGTLIAEAEVHRPHLAGILIEGGSHSTTIRDSVIWQARQEGILIETSDCAVIDGVRILDTRHEGILLRGSRGAQVTAAEIIGAGHAGLMIAGLPETAATRVAGNRFAANRSAIETAAPGRVALHGNDLTKQFPRFLDGDVEVQTPQILRDLRGEAEIVLTAGGSPVTLPPAARCLNTQEF